MKRRYGKEAVLSVLLCSATLLSCSVSQKQSGVVATVGGATIDSVQLKRSFALEPKWQKGMTNAEAYGRQLQYLINEKLYALAARAEGMDRDSTVAAYLAFVRDKELIKELYRQEVAAKADVTDQDYRDGYRWMKKRVTFRFIYSPDSVRSAGYAAKVRTGEFEAMGIADPVHEVKGIRRDVTFGDIAPEIERAVFDAGLNDVAGPVRIEGGFMVIQVIGGTQEKFASEYERAEQAGRVRKVVFDRKADAIARAYIASVMQDKQLTLDPDVFFSLASYTAQYVSESGLMQRNPGSTAVRDAELRQISMTIEALADRTLATHRDGRLTVAQFVEKIGAMPPGMRPRIRSAQNLKDAIAVIVRNDYLAGIAKARGFERNDAVQREIAAQTDQALATVWFARTRNAVPVTAEEIAAAQESAPGTSANELQEKIRDARFGGMLPGIAEELQHRYDVSVDSTQLKTIIPHPEEVIDQNPAPFFVREIFQ